MAASMMEIVKALAPLNRAVCSPDYDRAIEYLCDLLPFDVLEFDAAADYNGWVVPPYWEVLEARIERDGRIIYDGTLHPLAVIAQSTSFQGRLSLAQLRPHLYFDHRFANALPFHYRQQFRSWQRDWGFCVPRTLFEGLTEGDYDITILTRESSKPLRMVEMRLDGARKESIAICANLDHAGLANDGVAGVAVAVELFRRLAQRPRRFGYRLVLCQGIIGTEFYLGKQNAADRSTIFEALCLWMLGSRTELSLQESVGARSNVERALAHVMNSDRVPFRRGAFGEIIINDEYIWEAHGIPTASLSRYPYPEYHSSLDNLDIIEADRLEEALGIVERSLARLEASHIVRKRYSGTVCLSNPKYDLYVDAGQAALGDGAAVDRLALRKVMDHIPTLRGPTTVAELAERYGLPEQDVEAYLRRWESKGLISLD